MTMDQQDYFDDDDMINDYIEEDFDEPPPPPPFSDEDMLEEEELQAVAKNTQNNPESSTLPTVTRTEGSPVGKDADVDMEGVEDEIGGPCSRPPATSIRLDFAAKPRRKQKEDIYSFERCVR